MIRSPDQIIKRVNALESGRSTWRTQWQEVGDYIIPRKSDITSTKTAGDKRNAKVLDNTGMVACELLAGHLHGLLTNPATEFFELTTGDESVDNDDLARRWLQDTARKIHNRFNNSNFQTETHEFYLDICGFNTAGILVLDDDEFDVRFQAYYLKEMFISENRRGWVDEIYKKFQWNVKNIVDEFGLKNCPKTIQEHYKNEQYETMFEIIHAIYPVDMNGKKLAGFTHKIVSQYVFVQDKADLRISGFQEQPFAVARWAKASGEIYGRGPGINALPEVKMINLMEEAVIRGAQLKIAPPVQMPDQGFTLPTKFVPHGINYYRSGSKDRIEPVFPTPGVEFAAPIMEARRARIREAFYLDQLQIQQRDRQTATEVMQQREEKMRFQGPLLSRLEVEFLAPVVNRTFAIMLRKNRFLIPPRILQGKKLQVKFSSAIAKVMRAGEVKNLFDTLQVMAPLITLDPSVKDNFDLDAITRGTAQKNSLPQEYLKNKDDVAKIRDARLQAEQEKAKMLQEQHQAQVVQQTVPAAAQMMQAQNQQPPPGEVS